MPLTLITGPANAAKAGDVLERFRAALPREPVLVVPTPADAEHYQRELSAEGIVVGAEVVTFDRLVRELAAVAGVRARVLGPVARERLVRAVVAEADLHALARSAAAPGFAGGRRSAVRRARPLADRPRAVHARACATGRPPARRRRTRASSRSCTRPTTAGSTSSGAVDAEGLARAALDALRAAARRLARPAGVPLRVRRPDRAPARRDRDAGPPTRTSASRSRTSPAAPRSPGSAATVELLKPLAERHESSRTASEHYAPAARAALHHLERGLFEAAARCVARRTARCGCWRRAASAPRPSWSAAEVLELMRDGVRRRTSRCSCAAGGARCSRRCSGVRRAGERGPPRAAGAHAARRGRAGGRAGGAAGGSAADLLAWLRTPGRLADPDARRRARGSTSAARRSRPPREAARACAARARRALDALAAAAEPGAELLDALVAEADAIWTAPHRARGRGAHPGCATPTRASPRALRDAAAELRALAVAEPALARHAEELLEALGARARCAAGDEGAASCSPTRSRSARAASAPCSCAGCRRASSRSARCPSRSSTTTARRALARARRARAAVPRGRARPRALPVLRLRVAAARRCCSCRRGRRDEEGEPQVQPSPFLDDVRALFTDELWEQRGRRLLAEVTWPPATAPTPRELQRAQAAARNEPEPPPLRRAR